MSYPPLPHLATTDDAAYEWLLSDHPWAVAERRRRRADYLARTLAEADDALKITDRLTADPAAFSLHRVADTVDRIARRSALVAEVDDAEDDATRVERDRRSYVAQRRTAGDLDYAYPAHLIGPSAADYPPPPEALGSIEDTP